MKKTHTHTGKTYFAKNHQENTSFKHAVIIYVIIAKELPVGKDREVGSVS